MSTGVDQWNDLIIKSAEQFRLDANLIRAIIAIESSGDPQAKRFEPRWQYFNHVQTWADHLNIPRLEEERMQATSLGLMQVMGASARDMGFTDHLKMLFVPEIGVFYGCKKLAKLFERYHTEEDVVSAYNQGNNRMINEMYANQRYVDKVYRYLRDLRRLDYH